jgi:hypothetical protein
MGIRTSVGHRIHPGDLFVGTSQIRGRHTFGDLALAGQKDAFCGITVLHCPPAAPSSRTFATCAPAHLRTCGQTQSMLFSSRDMRWIKGDAPALDETPVPRFRRDSAGSGHDLRLRRRWADTAVRRALVPSSPLARSRGEADCTEWRPMDTTVG